MNLTQQQRDLLKVLVKNNHLGEFVFSPIHGGNGLIYTRGKGEGIPAAMDLSDFDQLASEGMITFSRFGKNPKGKVTQKGIEAVHNDFGTLRTIGGRGGPVTDKQASALLTAFAKVPSPPLSTSMDVPSPPLPGLRGHPASWPAQRKKMEADLAEIGKPRSLEEEALPSQQQKEPVVFIGHGHEREWKDLRDMLNDEGVKWIEFNSDDAVGMATTQRLAQMLDKATFAFLVMTAEDKDSDGKHHARANVIHEAGLFQGKLGFDKAILLVEDGCSEFSNIHGLGYIPFQRGNMEGAFYKIRNKLIAAGIISR